MIVQFDVSLCKRSPNRKPGKYPGNMKEIPLSTVSMNPHSARNNEYRYQ